MLSPETTEWFLSERGITSETLEAFGVYEEEDGAIVYPYGEHVKKRYGLGAVGRDRKFFWPKGVPPQLFNKKELEYGSVFLVEGETDTMRLRQELGDAEVGVVGVPGIDSWRKMEFNGSFEHHENVWLILDNDEDYNVKGQVDTAWQDIRKTLGRKAQRIVLPSGVKDVCEFFQYGGTLDTLRELVEQRAVSSNFHYKAVDFDGPVPQYDWLVQDWIAKGDLVLLFGEPGLGKSMIAQSLSVAIAQGFPDWLGLDIGAAGRVLYVDEENPEDVIRHRLRDLGLDKGTEHMRYLVNQGVRLDRNPEQLLDEAYSWEPELIVLDALARFHSGNENDAGEMGRLFNDGIKPLARDVGATVIVIHHAGKGDASSSYSRARGSGDITGVVDASLDVKKVAHKAGQLRIVASKNRRGRSGKSFDLRIEENPLGGVRLLGAPHAEIGI